MKKLVTPFRVGLLVIAAAAALFAFLSWVKKGGIAKKQALSVHAYFKDASGLGKKSRVQIAGIPVGEIDAITLEGNRARVDMKIRRDVGLHVDAAIRKRSESLLGDYMLDLFPGSEVEPLMPDGGEITHVYDQQGMDAMMESAQKIASDVQAITSTLRRVLASEHGEQSLQTVMDNLVSVSNQLDDTLRRSSDQLDGILRNVGRVSNELAGMTSGESQSVREIIANVDSATRDIKDVMGQVKSLVGENQGEMKQGVSSIKDSMAKLDRTLANLEEVTSKIREGKGTVGELISDERLGEKLADTVSDLSDFSNRLTGLKLEASIRSEYLINQAAARDVVGFRIFPKPDKYYLLELVDDPRGEVSETIVQNNPPAVGQPATQIQRTTRETLTFTAEFAKRYYFLTLRLGLFQSTGGVGADLDFFNDHLELKFDAYNFSVTQLVLPRLRATVRVKAFDHLYATAGMDDILNNPVRDSFTNRLISGRDFFAGAGVYFTDDDLKSLLVITGVPHP